MSTTSAPDDLNQLSDTAFRGHIREWIEQNYPAALRNPPKRLHHSEGKPWYLALAKKGWLAPGWPREHGGMGLSVAKQLIMTDEYERHGVARMADQGIVMIGPLLMRYGTDAQRQQFLPRILSGDDIWCQGYSEPNAGSDLASLRTEAVLDGDHWVVNGSKIWTTLGNDANWMFMLVRTDKQAKQQRGISFLLVPMNSPGITVRPIVTIDLHDEFCEVFFDNVRVPQANLVGEINKGWSMAKALLGFERIFLGSPRQSAYALVRLAKLADRLGLQDDDAFQDRYTQLRLDLADHNSLYEVFADRLRRGETIGPDISLLKISQTELYQRISDLILEISGENAGLLAPMDGNDELHPGGVFLQARPTTIYGGSSEIQRNIIAKNVLELPDQ
jgi:alkylation response protein AidB-like acyl-CoA dehydrogenase